MKRLKFINEWNSFTEFGFFQIIHFQVGIAIGKVGVFSLTVAPGMANTIYISVVVLGLGFSLLVGPRYKGIFR